MVFEKDGAEKVCEYVFEYFWLITEIRIKNKLRARFESLNFVRIFS